MILELPFAESLKRETVPPGDPRVGELLRFLRGRGWVKRAAIASALGWPEREVGRVKASARGKIISESSRGYKLALDATVDELWHARNEAASRIRELQAYIVGVDRVIHGRSTETVSGGAGDSLCPGDNNEQQEIE
jgi:hypothetical protein